MRDALDDFVGLLGRFTAAVESGDADAFVALFCADGVYDDVFYGEFKGRERLAEMLREHFHAHARDFRWEMHDPVCDGRVGYVNYTFSYTSTMPRSAGRRVVFTGCARFRLRDGLVESYREWALGAAGLAQLGAPPEVLARQAERESARIRAAADRARHELGGIGVSRSGSTGSGTTGGESSGGGRLPPLEPSALDDAQSRVLEAMMAGPRGKTGFLSPDRPVGGPFAPWLRSPGFADLAQGLGAFVRYRTSIEPRLSELAIIVVGAAWKAAYEFAAHGPLAIRAGVSREVVEAVARGDVPRFEHDDERAVYEFARDLVEERMVSEERYAAVVELLGESGTVELVGTLGYYTLVCMTLNAFEVPLGEGMEPPFAAP